MPTSASLDFHGMVGRSPAMQELFQKIERVAPIDVPVMVVGESGTGKELVARAIQRLSRRHGQRFETVNCGALTRELLLSELFGHERGAFTGAVARKEGLLAVADRGSLFLDEVGELPPDAQAMLLRFLQYGEVGSTQTRQVDVRVISATNRDLERAIEQGTFREDLYYRLCDVVLEVPPLRARPKDIPLLAEHFRAQFNRQYGFSIEPMGEEVRRILEAAPWRGNVRELEKALKQAMIFRGAGALGPEDLRSTSTWRREGQAVRGADAHGRPVHARAAVEPRREVALRLARARGAVTRRDLARACGVSGEIARQELVALARLGYLQRVGDGPSTRYVLR